MIDSNSINKYDFFISHASEDKDAFVRELTESLNEKNFTVWYDEKSLKLGDSLTDSINAGIAHCVMGIVVLSPDFFQKRWPKRELAALMAREDGGEQVILPIWHNISINDVRANYPLLADKIAVNSEIGVDRVVMKIIEVLKPNARITDLHELRADEINILFGTVSRLTDRGFGFITGSFRKDIFFHNTEVREETELYEGDHVAFLAGVGGRGPRAFAVKRIPIGQGSLSPKDLS